MATLSERLKAIVASGRHPQIVLYPGHEVIIPKRRSGRPRVRDEQLPFKHYADPRASKRRPRCLAPTCNKRLRVDQRGACCEVHRDAVFNEAMRMLHVLGLTREQLMQELGQHYR